MMITGFTTLAAIVLGLFLPIRWRVWGFIGGAAVLFAAQIGLRTALGFEGASIDESLLLFNGSWAAYVGFNMQVTYRAFALPLLALAVPLLVRAKGGGS